MEFFDKEIPLVAAVLEFLDKEIPSVAAVFRKGDFVMHNSYLAF